MSTKENRPLDGNEQGGNGNHHDAGEASQFKYSTTAQNALLSAALDYAAHSVPVFPLAPGTKVPAIPRDEGGHGFKDATIDVAIIRSWWRRWPRANVGIPTGAVSGFFVIDVDPRHGGDLTLAALQATFGALPLTRTARTPQGGLHLYFKHPGPGVRIPCDNKGKLLGPGIDIKGDGGYVVAPPSCLSEVAWGYIWKAEDDD